MERFRVEASSTNRFLWDGWLAVAEISDTGVVW